MIMWDTKKAVGTIMKSKDSGDAAPMVPSEAQTSDGEMDGRHAAAQDVLSAINEKHPGKLMEALGNFHDLHKMRSESED